MQRARRAPVPTQTGATREAKKEHALLKHNAAAVLKRTNKLCPRGRNSLLGAERMKKGVPKVCRRCAACGDYFLVVVVPDFKLRLSPPWQTNCRTLFSFVSGFFFF